METGCWNLVGAGYGGGGGRGYNGNFTTTSSTTPTHAWDIWQLGSSSRYDWIDTNHHLHPPTTTTTVAADDVSAIHALLHHHEGSPSVSFAGAGPPDPQLTMFLKLGKRHYFEDSTTIPFGERHVEGTAVAKRGRVVPYYCYGDESTTGVTVAAPPPPPPPPAVAVPRCQVEGCEAALLNAKDYHRRHKVCVMHSKAPKVNVNGIEQRFCQQCSRFHEVSEFDETKRSCRRRLAGHNERRRKTSSSHHHPLHGRFSSTATGHALSLLSSENNDQHLKIFSPSDLSSRCSDALRELIAENRAYSSNLSKHQLFIPDKANHTFTEEPFTENQNNTSHNSQLFNDNHDHQILHDHYADSWGRFNEEAANPNVTLNLAPASAFEILSMRGKSSKDKSEECSDIWSSLGGTHVV